MSFNVEKNVDELVKWIREIIKNANAKGAVIGVSGGKDSGACLGLLVRALGKENVFGVLMPNGVQNDIDDSEDICRDLDVSYTKVDIKNAYDGIVNSIGFLSNSESFVNINPRLRMTVLYAIAAEKNYLVCGTGNRSESYVGYFTKWGDGGHDFNPIGNFTTEEVIAIGDYLNLSKAVMHKTPSDGISGLSDEEKLGFAYNDVNRFLENGEIPNKEIEKLIIKKHEQNTHKLIMPPKFEKIN